jgi:hypothetical protein
MEIGVLIVFKNVAPGQNESLSWKDSVSEYVV